MLQKLEKVNLFFEKLAKEIVKRRWVVIAACLVLTVIAGIGLPRIQLDNSIEGWFMEGAEIEKAQDEFEKRFGNSDFVAFLVEADDVFSADILKMLRRLARDLENEVEFAKEVTSIADMEFSYAEGEEIIIEDLMPDPVPEDPRELARIKERAMSKDFLKDRIFTADASKTWVMLELYPFPEDWEKKYSESPTNLVGKKVLEILKREKYADYNIKSTGMPVLSVEEMQFAEMEMGKLTGLAILVSIIVLIIFLRSLRGVLIPLITTIVSIVIVFGMMGLLGIKINATMMSVPVFLGFAVSIGYSIHVFNFYKRQKRLKGKNKEAVYFAVKQSGWPIFFTAMTTIASLLSFYFISLVPIQWLGLTSAACIISVYLLVMTLLPALLSFEKDRDARKLPSAEKIKRTDRYFDRLSGFVFKYSLPILIIFVLLAGILAYGMTKIEIDIDTKRSYGTRVPYVNRMLEIARTKIGSFLSYDLTLDFKKQDAVKDPEVLARFNQFTEIVEKRPYTKRTSSILHILKDMNKLLHQDKAEFYRLPKTRTMVAQQLFLYEMAGGSNASQWVNSDYSTLRLMVEVSDMDADQIQATLDFLDQQAAELFPEAEFAVVGSLPQFFMLNKYIAVGQIKSFAIAIAVIALLLMIVFRSIKTGLIGLIPNITPAITIGGLMGFLNIPLDFMTVTMMPMILGLAVDDTIHFISHAGMHFQEEGEYKKALRKTYHVVGKSLFMTSVILIAAFSVYYASTINMFVTFGLFVTLGIASALLADYLVTPVLLKWTKAFGPENNNKE